MGRKAHESRLAFLSSEHRFVPADSASRLRAPGEKTGHKQAMHEAATRNGFQNLSLR